MNLHSLYKTQTKKIVELFPRFSEHIAEAILLIESIPGYAENAGRLRRLNIELSASLPDRAQTSLLSKIVIGPKVFSEAIDDDSIRVGLAGTLIHEEFHTRQNPFFKTISVWSGVFTRTHPMARYEWPAYRAQTTFLRRLKSTRPDLSKTVDREVDSIREAVYRNYGRPPYEL